MKKALFFAFSLLVAASTFVGCNKKDDPSSDVTITLSDSTLLLSPGSEQRLTYTVAPAGTSVTLAWASSDEEVATVSQSGIVTAVAEGTATITATSGKVSAKCVVTVSNEAVYENFTISDWGLFGKEFVEIEGTDTVLSLSIGDLNCHLATISLLLWSDGLVYDDGFSGAGYLIEAGDVPVYVIDDENAGQYNGYYIGGAFYIKEAQKAYTCTAGALDVNKYGKWWESYLAYSKDTTLGIDINDYYEALSGAVIYYYSADDDYQTWGLGYITNGGFGEDEDEEKMYYADVTWLDYTSDDRFYGIKVTLDDDGYVSSIVTPYDVKTIEKSFSENMPESSVSGKQVPTKANLHLGKEVPTLNHRIPTNRFYKK